jgi:hypothetical protein
VMRPLLAITESGWTHGSAPTRDDRGSRWLASLIAQVRSPPAHFVFTTKITYYFLTIRIATLALSLFKDNHPGGS